MSAQAMDLGQVVAALRNMREFVQDLHGPMEGDTWREFCAAIVALEDARREITAYAARTTILEAVEVVQ